jgi:hypothetical protein|tara:strand:+ start:109 stop:918 length:810 start_codon:yes stop_codon:yes gene_type:complete
MTSFKAEKILFWQPLFEQSSINVTRICIMKISQFSIILALTLISVAAHGDPDPTDLAAESLGKLAKAEAISVDIAIAEEAVLSQGLKIRTLREGSVVLSRAKGFKFSRSGALLKQQVAYDGNNVYGIGDKAKVFVSVPISGTNDEVMDVLTKEAGAYLPGRDLFYKDAAEELLAEVLEAHYLGIAPVAGAACHYVVFRGPDVDWHLWINESDMLPSKYLITSKWMTGSPEFEMTFSNWNLNPSIDDQTFVLSAPAGYAQAKFIDMQPTH